MHDLLLIAEICHEANRAYCHARGDDSQLTWKNAPEWQRLSARQGVIFAWTALAGGKPITPELQHEAWMEAKIKDGWTYGETKDADKKTHPCLLPYAQLPYDQRIKDFIFLGIVKGFFEARP